MTLTTTTHAIEYIVSTPDICGGKPRIDGTRLTVEFLSVFIEGSRTVEDLGEDFGITPAQIYAAWSYYFDHQEEIDAQLAADALHPRPDEAEHQIILTRLKTQQNSPR